jgi:hypothetical protein
MKEAIAFAIWIQDKGYKKKKYTHPNKIGEWFSDSEATGFLKDEELYDLFKTTQLKNIT